MRSSLLGGLAIVSALLLAGCGLLSSAQEDESVGWSAQRLYGEAKDAMTAKEWTKAIKYLEKLEARYPYGRYAQQAQLEVAYAHYKDGDRRRGSLHQAVSESSQRRLRLLPEGADQLQRAARRAALVSHHAGHDGPRSEGLARSVRRVQGGSDPFSGIEVRGGLGSSHALSRQRARVA